MLKLKSALLNLLSKRYELDKIQDAYNEVKELAPKTNETINAHMEKLKDIMDGYNESKAYDLRNLISYHMLETLG